MTDTTVYTKFKEILGSHEAASFSRVDVNQRALIDKILSRYASAFAVYRELLANSNDAQAKQVEIHFTIDPNRNNGVTQVLFRNNGLVFREEDWQRLTKIAEGNPDCCKVGGFGVGAYAMFSFCEEPMVISGKQALLFCWKNDSLWTKNVAREDEDDNWSSFVMPTREPMELPNFVQFGRFLCESLIFTGSLETVIVHVNSEPKMVIAKKLVKPPVVVNVEDYDLVAEEGMFSIESDTVSTCTWLTAVEIEGQVSWVETEYFSVSAESNYPPGMAAKIEQATKKKPPAQVKVQVAKATPKKNGDCGKAASITRFLSSQQQGAGKVFVGFKTSQTTGFMAHVSAPFVPTVEREALDLQDPRLKLFNTELLQLSGFLMRIFLERSMSTVGAKYSHRIRCKEESQKETNSKKSQVTEETSHTQKDVRKSRASAKSRAEEEEESTSEQTAESVLDVTAHTVEELSHTNNTKGEPSRASADTLKIAFTTEKDKKHDPSIQPDASTKNFLEVEAILLMKAFTPTASYPEHQIGQAVWKGFYRSTTKLPSILTRTGVVHGSQARMPSEGLEGLVVTNVIPRIICKHASEYVKMSDCQPLTLCDLESEARTKIFKEEDLIELLKWWKTSTTPTAKFRSLHAALRFYQRDPLGTDEYVKQLCQTRHYIGDEFLMDDNLPMPPSVLPRHIQACVGVSALQGRRFLGYFTPLSPLDWATFISGHKSMNTGQKEDDKVRLDILAALSRLYHNFVREQERAEFAQYCKQLLSGRKCIPTGCEDSYQTAVPYKLYLPSMELAFHAMRASPTLWKVGVSDQFLEELGVKASVSTNVVFDYWENSSKCKDQKELIGLLKMPSVSEAVDLCLPNPESRRFSCLKLLKWPNDIALDSQDEFSRFLERLGVAAFPPIQLLLVHVTENEMGLEDRLGCLDFISKHLAPAGCYYPPYNGDKRYRMLRFLPCISKSPLSIQQETEESFQCPLECFSDERCVVMGFSILNPKLGERLELYEERFQCSAKPTPKAVLRRFHGIVQEAKTKLKTSFSEDTAQHVLRAFPVIFEYMSLYDWLGADGNKIASLHDQPIIPVRAADGSIEWRRPKQVLFWSGTEKDIGIRKLFPTVQRCRFFEIAGVQEYPSARVLLELIKDSPQNILERHGEENYRALLRYISMELLDVDRTKAVGEKQVLRKMFASNLGSDTLFGELLNTPFLLAHESDKNGKSVVYSLAKPNDVYILDNWSYAEMFQVKRAPYERDLELLYVALGVQRLSEAVDVKFKVEGKVPVSPVVEPVEKRLLERKFLLVSPDFTSRPLRSHAASLLDPDSLQVFHATEIRAVYSLDKGGRKGTCTRQTTCCCKPSGHRRRTLYITENFDWFDVGRAIGILILKKCDLEDAFFITALLEAPDELLLARGFPLDRVRLEASTVKESIPPSRQGQEDRNTTCGKVGPIGDRSNSAAPQAPSAESEESSLVVRSSLFGLSMDVYHSFEKVSAALFEPTVNNEALSEPLMDERENDPFLETSVF